MNSPSASITTLNDGVIAIDTEYARPLQDASHLIVSDGKAAFVDTGTNNSVPLLLDALEQQELKAGDVDYVFLTHIHLDHAGGVCVATGGTVGALARLVATYRSSWPTRSVSQLFVTADELHELTAELVASSHEQRLRMPGIQKPRADLLPAGAVILESAVAELGLDGFIVSDWGLREGVILESLGLVPTPGERPTVGEADSKPA